MSTPADRLLHHLQPPLHSAEVVCDSREVITSREELPSYMFDELAQRLASKDAVFVKLFNVRRGSLCLGTIGGRWVLRCQRPRHFPLDLAHRISTTTTPTTSCRGRRLQQRLSYHSASALLLVPPESEAARLTQERWRFLERMQASIAQSSAPLSQWSSQMASAGMSSSVDPSQLLTQLEEVQCSLLDTDGSSSGDTQPWWERALPSSRAAGWDSNADAGADASAEAKPGDEELLRLCPSDGAAIGTTHLLCEAVDDTCVDDKSVDDKSADDETSSGSEPSASAGWIGSDVFHVRCRVISAAVDEVCRTIPAPASSAIYMRTVTRFSCRVARP